MEIRNWELRIFDKGFVFFYFCKNINSCIYLDLCCLVLFYVFIFLFKQSSFLFYTLNTHPIEIFNLLETTFGKEIIKQLLPNSAPLCIEIEGDFLEKVCNFLYENESCYFDTLACLTALDNGTEANTMEVWYHLFSLPHQHSLALRVVLARENPRIMSINHIWQTANWHEREAYDLLGITFEHHPHLTRILLTADWEGHPLRKDYRAQELYHGIMVKY